MALASPICPAHATALGSAMIKKGDHVTCTNGHIIADVLEDIGLGTVAWGQYIGNWRQEDHPRIGEMNPSTKCATCGAVFMDDAWRLHISGWRP